MKKIITCLLATFGLTTGCCQQDYENTDPEGFARLIAQPDVVLLDVRTAEEFQEGHIEGALNIDMKQADFMERTKAALPREKTMDQRDGSADPQFMICLRETRTCPRCLRSVGCSERWGIRWLVTSSTQSPPQK